MNAKELILAKINSGNKLAKMYSFLITLGVDLNDIVSFMTSDVASFIDAVTESDIFNDYNVKIEDAIQIAKTGNVPRKYNKHKDKILALYNEHKLNDASNRDGIIADVNEFTNILEGANEFSNFARLLGLNQGIPVTKVDILNALSFIQSIFNKRLDEYKKSNPTEKWVENIDPFNVYKWMKDENYREEISKIYNRIKKCINVFDIFNSISLFDAIRLIFSAVLDTDPVISIKSKIYDKLYDAAKKRKLFTPENYLSRLLGTIDNNIIANFIISRNIKIPVKAGTKYLNNIWAVTESKVDNNWLIRTKEDILSFKYLFENTIIPLLKQGKTWEYRNGLVFEKLDITLKNNDFIKALLITTRHDTPIYTVDLNMLTIENSTDSLQKFLKYSSALLKLSTIKFGDKTIADWFILYNLIINKNQYGANRLTTLFDTFLKSDTSTDLLNDYFDYVSKLDYESDVSLDIDSELKNLVIGYRDSLISAAAIVRSQFGKSDPFIIVNNGNGPMLMLRTNNGSYTEVLYIVEKIKGESPNDYLERVNNFIEYNTLGINISELLNKLINEILALKEDAVARLNDFITKGILLILKICQ